MLFRSIHQKTIPDLAAALERVVSLGRNPVENAPENPHAPRLEEARVQVVAVHRIADARLSDKQHWCVQRRGHIPVRYSADGTHRGVAHAVDDNDLGGGGALIGRLMCPGASCLVNVVTHHLREEQEGWYFMYSKYEPTQGQGDVKWVRRQKERGSINAVRTEMAAACSSDSVDARRGHERGTCLRILPR